jgi:hypothetical protein
MKLKKNSLFIPLLFLSIITFGQEDSGADSYRDAKKNTVEFTIAGSGLIASFNYGRVLVSQPNYFIIASLGVGAVTSFSGGTTIPHQLTFNIGKKTSFLELGIGGSYWTGKTNESGFTESETSYNLSPIIGWRKIFKKNMVFRVYANPLIHVSGVYVVGDYAVYPFMGVSLGYRF